MGSPRRALAGGAQGSQRPRDAQRLADDVARVRGRRSPVPGRRRGPRRAVPRAVQGRLGPSRGAVRGAPAPPRDPPALRPVGKRRAETLRPPDARRSRSGSLWTRPRRNPTPRRRAPGFVGGRGRAPRERERLPPVAVDKALVRFLRPHQREGVKFMFECVMGLRDFAGEGCILADDMGLGEDPPGDHAPVGRFCARASPATARRPPRARSSCARRHSSATGTTSATSG